jgi:hypothetical protein
MADIYVESKGPQGPQIKESLRVASPPASSPSRGLAVTYGSDALHAALVVAATADVIGILEEDVVSVVRGGTNTVGEDSSVIEFGQAVAQIGGPLAANASGQLVPANPGQLVVAIALEAQVYVSPGSFACVMVIANLGIVMPGSQVAYYAAAGAIPVASGTAVINGAAALAMTLAAPTAAQDGTVIAIVADTAHAHTVTTPVDAIYGTKDTVTFAALGDIVVLEAVNTKWMVRAIGGPTPAALSEV